MSEKMALKLLHICPLFLGFLLISGVNCSEVESDGLEGVNSYHVVFGVVLLACFIALLALCGGQVDVARPAPTWILQLDIDPEVDKGITGVSDGLTITNPTTVTRHRKGNFETDGAKFGAALSTGKHVFEIHWDKDERGLFATVGVGSDSADMICKPRDSLVGNSRHSWGFDISRRKLVHRGAPLANPGSSWRLSGMVPKNKGKHVFEIHWPKDERGLFATVGVGSENADMFCKPRDALVGKDRFSFSLDISRRKIVTKGQATQNMPLRGFVPEKFYMYVDCDSGTLGFGSDVEYWGAPHNIPREHFPVYPMIGCCCPDATINMIYRGSENKNKAPQNLEEVTVADADGKPLPGASNALPPPGAGYGHTTKKEKKDKKDKGKDDELKQALKMGKKGFKMFDKFINN